MVEYTPVNSIKLVTETIQLQHPQQLMFNLSSKQAARYLQQEHLFQTVSQQGLNTTLDHNSKDPYHPFLPLHSWYSGPHWLQVWFSAGWTTAMVHWLVYQPTSSV